MGRFEGILTKLMLKYSVHDRAVQTRRILRQNKEEDDES